MVTLARQPGLQFRPEAAHPQAARPLRAAAALPGPQLLGRQGPGRAATTSASRRRSTPSCRCSTARPAWTRSRSGSRTSFPPQKITLEELQQFLGMLHRSGLVIAAVPGQGHAAPQAPQRAPPQGIAQRAGQHPLHPLQGLRSRAVAELALPQVRWFFSPLAVRLLPAAGAVGGRRW